MKAPAELRRIVQPHVDNLNRLFNRTISESRLDSETAGSNPRFHLITRRTGGVRENMELTRGSLEFSQTITELNGLPHVTVAVYIYWLTDSDWVFRYEYETHPDEGKPHSHLHVNGRSTVVDNLPDIHFPAGRLSVEHLIYHLVREYGVKSRMPDAKLLRFLADSYRTWKRTDREAFP